MGQQQYTLFYNAVHAIPRGQVATYGQVAQYCGLPGHARMVGYALSILQEPHDVPWHRVINARGEISPGGRPGRIATQKALLMAEGVVPDGNGRINLRQYQWRG